MVINNHLANALAVLTRNPITRTFLEFNDPKGLEQARAALRDAGVDPDPRADVAIAVDQNNGEATLAEVLYRYPGVLGLLLTLKSPATPAEWRATAARYLDELEATLRNGGDRG
jgi:hypothetical protein